MYIEQHFKIQSQVRGPPKYLLNHFLFLYIWHINSSSLCFWWCCCDGFSLTQGFFFCVCMCTCVCVCVYVTNPFSSLLEPMITKKTDYRNSVPSIAVLYSSKCEIYFSLN